MGRVTVGEGAYLGPSATISNGLAIGAGARVTLGAVVTQDVASGGHVSGVFAIDHEKFLEAMRKRR